MHIGGVVCLPWKRVISLNSPGPNKPSKMLSNPETKKKRRDVALMMADMFTIKTTDTTTAGTIKKKNTVRYRG